MGEQVNEIAWTKCKGIVCNYDEDGGGGGPLKCPIVNMSQL